MNVGVTFGLTVTVIVAVLAHAPATGVKVYVVVVVVLILGLQVPEIEVVFEELVGKENEDPVHFSGTAVKVGVIFGLIVTVNLEVDAHEPAAGVNVYSVVVELLKAGLQVPEIEGVLVELVGSVILVPVQTGEIELKVGDI